MDSSLGRCDAGREDGRQVGREPWPLLVRDRVQYAQFLEGVRERSQALRQVEGLAQLPPHP